MKSKLILNTTLFLFLFYQPQMSNAQTDNKEGALISYKLAYVLHVIVASPEEINDQMKTFINSEQYLNINDLDGRGHLKKAFETIREVLKETGIKQGMLIGEVQHYLVLAGAYFKLPECESFKNATGMDYAIEAMKAASKMAERGKSYW